MKRLNPRFVLLIIVLIIIGPGEAFINNGMDGVIDWFMSTIMMLPGIVIGLSFHEFGHAKAADLCGDNTPACMGRVTLDPRAHVDIAGIITLVFIHFGWGKPVMINPSNFKHRRLDSIIVDFAGVFMNFVIALVFCLGASLIYKYAPGFVSGGMGYTLIQLMIDTAVINLSLMLFNLIPCPPLDGFGIITDLFDLYGTKFHTFVARNSLILIMLLILFDIPSILITRPLYAILNWMMSII